ncbi:MULTISPECIES: DUF2304 domain-containing protein [Plantibacter]|uniref:DUF2304 domain-containing protein n=1 Tax=Plantibacter cousiniae (nom. nud.) TaxID=199709 RepID=A0ABY1LRW9_9MICO|nr:MULTISPECIES: DUF2304 domain-containing protein [Plantibacter]SKC74322.1 hypothetical protein SAMN06295973_3641 [Plantibacter cousiniae]VXC41533.1 conserved membrane hypothetical protein [Plantibacter sp. T3]
MIPIGTYILGIVGAVLTLGIVVEMLRKRRLRERHAVWWLIAGLLALVIGVFPQVLVWAAGVIGVEIPTNLVFFVSIFILFLVSIQHSSELTTLENRSRTLAEESALQDLRIRALEQRLAEVPRDGSSPDDAS